MNANDAIFLERWIQHRDADAFRELVTHYAGMVYATCRRVLGSASDAEDVAQECFQALAMAPKAPADYLGPWLHRVAINIALKKARGEGRRRAREEQYAREHSERAEVAWDDLYQYVDEAIAALPAPLRDPVVAHYLEGHSQTEIAQAFGVPRQTLSNRIDKGIEEIRKTLRRRGVAVGGGVLAGLLGAHLTASAEVPETLVASLGRLALSGPRAAPVGLLAAPVKLALVAVTVVATMVLGTWGLRRLTPARPEKLTLAAPVREAPVSAEDPVTPAPAAQSKGAKPPASAAAHPKPSVSGIKGGESGTISGRVYDADTNAPIAGVWIRTFVSEGLVEGETDQDGTYQLTGLEPGPHKLEPSSGTVVSDGKLLSDRPRLEGYPIPLERDALTVNLETGAGVTGANFPLRKGLPITGKVADAAGTPLDDLTVTSDPLIDSALTAKGGAFTLWGFAEGSDVKLTAYRFVCGGKGPAIEGSTKPLAVGKGGLHDVVIKALVLGEISGQVVDAEGQPAPLMEVLVKPTALPPTGQEWSLHFPSAYSDNSGVFKLAGLPPTTYEIAVDDHRDRESLEKQAIQTVELPPGAHVQDVKVHYSGVAKPPLDAKAGALVISGRATSDTDAPVTFASIRAVDGPDGGFGHAEVAKDGTFSVTGLAEGAYTVEVSSLDYQRVSLPDVPAGTRNLNIRLVHRQKRAIVGRVVNAVDGTPVTDFQLSKSDRHLDAGLSGDDTPAARAQALSVVLAACRRDPGARIHDSAGKFVLNDVQDGPHAVIVQAPGYGIGMGEVEIKPDASTDGTVELRLQPEARIEGTVVDSAGHPLENIGICMGHFKSSTQKDLVGARLQLTRSNADGAFSIGGLLAGAVDLTACGETRPCAYATAALVAGKTEHPRIVMQAGATLAVEVTLAGAPQHDATVVVRASDGQVFTGETGDDGNCVLDGLEDGEKEVDVSLPSPPMQARCLIRKAILSAGKTTSLTVDFPAGAESLSGSVTVGGAIPDTACVALTITNLAGEREVLMITPPTMENGRFKIANPPAGEAVADIHATRGDETRSRKVHVRLEAGRACVLDENFEGGAGLSGTVAGVRDGEIGAVFVYARELAPGETLEQILHGQNGTPQVRTVVGADRTFHVEGLESGAYTVLALTMRNEPRDKDTPRTGLRMAQSRVTLTEGQVKEVAIALE